MERNKQQSEVGATVLRDLRGSQSEPLPTLLFLCSNVLYLFVCDEVALLARCADRLVMGHGTDGNTTPRREGEKMCLERVLTFHPTENGYKRNSLINSKPIPYVIKIFEKNVMVLVNSKKIEPVKIAAVTDFVF